MDTIKISKSNIPQVRSSVGSEIGDNIPVQPKKSTIPTIVVDLPSNGYFYPETSPLSTGKVEIYRATAKHEDILQNPQFIKKGVVLDEFLKAMIATAGVSIDDLTIGDKNAVFLAARRSTYGDDYQVKVKCPECGEESKVTIDLSQLKNREYDFSNYTKGENKFSFSTSSGDTVTWKLLTHKDENLIESEMKGLQKFNSSSSTEITTRLKYLILSVNGETDKGKIKKFIEESLPAKDSLALRREVKERMPDVDMTFDFTCPKCDYSGKISVPMSSEFLWPSVNE